MKRTSVIWVFILSVAVLATVATTYLLLDVKSKSLQERGKTEVTDTSVELTILNNIYKLKETLGNEREIKTLDIAQEKQIETITDVSTNNLKVSVPYLLNEENIQKENEKLFTSDEVHVDVSVTQYKDSEGNEIGYKESFSNDFAELNKFIGIDAITKQDINDFFNSYDSLYDMYKELLKVNKDTPIYYTSDVELKREFIKFYYASLIGVEDYIYKVDEKNVIFIYDNQNGNVTGGYITIFDEDSIAELYLLYNIEANEEKVISDFEYIISTINVDQ